MNTQVLQKGTHAAGGTAQRFMGLLQKQAAPALPVIPCCILHIDSGVHAGAQLRLRQSPLRIGSGADNDIVLHDAGVRPHHAELCRVDGRWSLVAAGGTAPFPPLQALARGRFLRQLYGIGAATLVLSQPVTDRKEPPRLRAGDWQRAAALLLLLLAVPLGTAAIVQMVRPSETLQKYSASSLAAQGWPDARLVVDPTQQVRVEGYVDDAAQLERLRTWLQEQGHGRPVLGVRVGAEWAARVRDALGKEALQVDYQGAGVVRVRGTTADIAVRKQLQQIRRDLEPAVRFADEVAYVDEAPQTPKPRLLPFRIVNVSPGENGSFTTDTGARYFTGAVLSDGAEVTAVDADAVEFRVDGKIILYPLK